ncbi:MAG: hypothetical protein RJA70_4353 [Pseudomonadota bacterium]|jgi:two-component system response regulator RegA
MNLEQFQGQSILVVDDDDLLRQQLARAFERRQLEVRSCTGFVEAKSLLETGYSPELAVVDLKMPDGNGLRLVELLHQADPNTKTVVLTGYGSIATAIDAVRLGATYFLQKPADAEEVLGAFLRDSPNLEGGAETELKAPTLARAEWEHIHRVLNDCQGNISEAARRLGLHRRSLQRKLQKFPPRQ